MDTLLILAHCDDEALSCGGLVQRRTEKELEVGLFTLFGRSYNYGKGFQYSEEQYLAWAQCCRNLGIGIRYCNDLPEGDTSNHNELKVLEAIERVLTKHKPTEVVIHDDQDRNQDHQWLSTVSKIALRHWAHPQLKRVLMCQSPDGLPKLTNHYEPMSGLQMTGKLHAMSLYTRESRENPHPRSPANLMALAQVAGSMCNEHYAEAYRIYYQKEA